MAGQDEAPGALSDVQVARQAAISSLASNAAMLALVVLLNLAVAKRHAIGRGYRRALDIVRDEPGRVRQAREIAGLRRDLCEISHALNLEAVTDEQPQA